MPNTFLVSRLFLNTADKKALADFRKKVKRFLKLCLGLKGIDITVPVVFETLSYPVHDRAKTFAWLKKTFAKEIKIDPLKIERGGLYANALNQAIQHIVSHYPTDDKSRVLIFSPEVELNQLIVDDLHKALNKPGAKIAGLNIQGLSDLILSGRIQNTAAMWNLDLLLNCGLFPLYTDGSAVGDKAIVYKNIELADNEEVALLAVAGKKITEPFIAIARPNDPVHWDVDLKSAWQQTKLKRKWIAGDCHLKLAGLKVDYLKNLIIK